MVVQQNPFLFWLTENGLILASFPITAIYIFVAFMFLDIVTGFLAALYQGGLKGLSSKTAYRGLVIKKFGYVIAIVFASLADILFLGTGGLPVFTTMAVMGFIAVEGISIIENLAKMGINLPFELGDRFKQITEHKEQLEIKSSVEKKQDGTTVIKNEVEVPKLPPKE